MSGYGGYEYDTANADTGGGGMNGGGFLSQGDASQAEKEKKVRNSPLAPAPHPPPLQLREGTPAPRARHEPRTNSYASRPLRSLATSSRSRR